MKANMCSDGLVSRTYVRDTECVNRTRVRWGRVGALTAALVLVMSLAGRALGGSPDLGEEGPRPQILVESGQTLWSIARAQVGPEGDPRPLIQDIRELNGMATSELEVGQRLLLPAAD
jgi:hypothetical protein